MKQKILIVEDEDKLRRVIQLQLAQAGFDVEQARTAEEALPLLDRADLVLTDLRLPGMSGLDMLSLIQRQNGRAPVIMMTAHGSIETAVEAMKSGAVDFLLKPFSPNQQNSLLSTGPTTEAGKQICSQNAAKHGFTGLSLIVTPAEKEAYDAHVQAYMDHHQPADHMHRQVVQQYADIHWSLHQIFVQQSNTISLMNAVAIQLNAAGDPIATAAAIAPIAKTLNTLNLYETRRRRALKTVKEELEAMDLAAAEKRTQELDLAAGLLSLAKEAGDPFDPQEFGFVCSLPEIERHLQASSRVHNSKPTLKARF